MNRLEFAKWYQDEGFSLLPLTGKKPSLTSWKRLQAVFPSDEQIAQWFAENRNNIGVVTGGISNLVVVDFDDKNLARDAYKTMKPKVIVRTPRGVHFAYRMAEEVRNRQGSPDVRGEGGYVCWPDSVVNDRVYRFIDGFSDLSKRTVFRPEWLHAEVAQSNPDGFVEIDDLRRITRARAYVSKCDAAVSGKGGHNRTFRVACKLMKSPPRGFGLTVDQAWPIMLEYNERCRPRWSAKELKHKLDSASF